MSARQGGSRRVQVGSRQLTVTNLDKPLWPADGLTKADLIAYYLQVAPVMLPHLAERPLVLTRYPDGSDGKSFYQKDLPEGAPPWAGVFPFAHGERTVHYVLAREPADLVWLANLAAIEIHAWLSRTARPAEPDYAVIDLDPAAGAGADDVRQVALLAREVLDRLRLCGVPKHSGATGLHIFVPLAPGHTFSQAADFVHSLGRLLRQVYPDKVTLERSVAKRAGKVYVDYLQNGQGKTMTAVYSLRPRPGAPLSAPLSWEEIAAGPLPRVTLREVGRRLAAVGDLFAPALQLDQDIRRPLQILQNQT